MEVSGRIVDGVHAEKPLEHIRREAGGGVSKTDFYRMVLELIKSRAIPNIMICYCGHDCGRCRTLRATLSGDDGLKAEIAAYYQSEIGMELAAADLRCFGGRSDEIMEGCRQCPFVVCCKARAIDACVDCEAYPCPMIRDYAEKYVNKANQMAE